jgi:hypothetical protein
LTDEGLLIAAGWEGFRRSAVPADAAQIQIDEMRLAFFAGADHLFVAMLKFLEEGEEPTAKDLKRMDLIHDELERFRNNELLKRMPTKGQG